MLRSIYMFAPNWTLITSKRRGQTISTPDVRRTRIYAAAALSFCCTAFFTGCSFVEGADMASLDLRKVTIDAPTPIRTGDAVTFVVNYSNRATEERQFRCKIMPGGREVIVTAPAESEDRDSEIVWPTLPQGRYKILCGITGDLNEAELFSLTKEFTVEGASAAAAAGGTSTQGLSLVRIAITENQKTWNGKLLVRTRFDNPGRDGGWIRCATSPESQGSQFARITRERQGIRVFEFTYPENLSARYTVMCTAHKSFADGPIIKAKSFYVGL